MNALLSTVIGLIGGAKKCVIHYQKKIVQVKSMSESSWETKGIDCEYFDKECLKKDCNSCPYRYEDEPDEKDAEGDGYDPEYGFG